MEVFVSLESMKYSQTNTKPSCTPRKLIGGLTQQSAQPETEFSRYVAQRGEFGEQEAVERRELLLWVREEVYWGGGRIREKHPSPKAAGEKMENWKQPQGLN